MGFQWSGRKAIANPLPECILSFGAAVVSYLRLPNAIKGGLGAIFPIVFGAALEFDDAGLVFGLGGAVERLRGASDEE